MVGLVLLQFPIIQQAQHQQFPTRQPHLVSLYSLQKLMPKRSHLNVIIKHAEPCSVTLQSFKGPLHLKVLKLKELNKK